MQDDGEVNAIRRYRVAEDNGQGATPELEQQSGGMLKDPQSRRRFLRAAAIGTAGVAGVAGAVGVAQATGAPKILHQVLGGTSGVSNTNPSIDGFFEHTDPGPCTSTYSGNQKDGKTGRFITFYISNLPSGNYIFTVTQDIGAGPVALETNGNSTASQPWEYAQGTSSIHLVVRTAGTKPVCPTDSLGSASPFNSFPITITSSTFSGTHDVAIYAHIDINGGVTIPSSTTFTGALSGDASLTRTVTVNENFPA
jgi:hypothetical protein